MLTYKGVLEYDPTKSNIIDIHTDVSNAPQRGDRGRGRGRGRGDQGGGSGRGRGGRAAFSHVGPNDDKSTTTIVVENIPDDKFNEQIVRDYFAEFGDVVELTMQPHKQLALIKFNDHAAAHRAWSNPKAIFDNRFVKVYWYKPKSMEANGSHREQQPESPQFDKEAFEKQQAEAQKAHEERNKKRKEAEETRLALEKQRDELMKRQLEEKARLLEKLGTSGSSGANGEAGDATGIDHDGEKVGLGAEENVSEQTKSLRAQLAALEAEAKSLGIDTSSTARGRGRGFSTYRGRGSLPPRGRGSDPFYRGGYRGRVAVRGGRGGVLRLDNRPKRVAVSGVEFDSAKDEALRQYLIVSTICRQQY